MKKKNKGGSLKAKHYIFVGEVGFSVQWSCFVNM